MEAPLAPGLVFCGAPGSRNGFADETEGASVRMSLKNTTETQPSVPPAFWVPVEPMTLVVVKQALVTVPGQVVAVLVLLVAPPMITARVGSTAIALPAVLGVTVFATLVL